jgi:hypothetical protein
VISSTNGCIFGGYTPLAWSSRNNRVSDPSLQSFVFTIQNPHNLPGRIFKQQKAEAAIYDHSNYGPVFGDNFDLATGNQFEAPNGSWSNLGGTYINDTGIAAKEVLTGANLFTVKEIEVLELVCNNNS